MACTMGYIEDVEQFARLGQLQQAINDVTPLMEDTTNFIVKFASDRAGVSVFVCVRAMADWSFCYLYSPSLPFSTPPRRDRQVHSTI